MGNWAGVARRIGAVTICIGAVIGLTSCGGEDSKSSESATTLAMPGDTAESGDTSSGRSIDRDVTVYVVVDDVGTASSGALAAITGAGGVVDASDISLKPASSASARIEARVPPDQLEAVVGDVAALGELTARQQTAADVTDQVTDLKNRIDSAQASVDRVRALLDSATDLQDVVLLEGELTKRQTELEQLEAQQQALASQTDMAGLVVQLSRTPAKVSTPGDTGVGDALRAGWDGFLAVLHVIVLVLSFLLPFLVVGAAVAAVVVVIRRRRRRNRSAAPPSPPAPTPGP